MIHLAQNAYERLGLTKTDLRDPFLRKFQRIFDPIAFDLPTWPLLEAGVAFRFAKTEYIGNHIGMALGKVLQLKMGEPRVDQTVRVEAFPDTLMYRTQLANTLRYDLKKRLGDSVTDSNSIVEADDLLTEARVVIDNFDKRIDQGVYLPRYLEQVRSKAIPALHFAGLIMANMFDVEPQVAHGERLIHKLRMQTTVIE